VDSTNNYAMGLVYAAMARHGTVVFAHEQTNGRGQRTRKWLSEPQANIAISVIIEPAGIELSKMFLLSKTIATGVLAFFNEFVSENIAIKWPNDIYWRDRKAGGILIENLVKGTEWKFAIAGIGLNINQTFFEGLEKKAVSLKQITGGTYDTLMLAKKLCTHLEKQFSKFYKTPELIVEEYHINLYKRGQKVKFKKEARVFEASVKDVSNMGELIVEHAMEERFNVGEVEWML